MLVNEPVDTTEKEDEGDKGKKKSEAQATATKWLIPADARFVLLL
jgi:hypothetical protein